MANLLQDIMRLVQVATQAHSASNPPPQAKPQPQQQPGGGVGQAIGHGAEVGVHGILGGVMDGLLAARTAREALSGHTVNGADFAHPFSPRNDFAVGDAWQKPQPSMGQRQAASTIGQNAGYGGGSMLEQLINRQPMQPIPQQPPR